MLIRSKTGAALSRTVDGRLLSAEFWKRGVESALELVAELAREGPADCSRVAELFLNHAKRTNLSEESLEAPDVIMVLGNALTGGDVLSAELEGRLEKALGLHVEFPTLPIVVSGGGQGKVSESEAMADWLVVRGVDRGLIRSEGESMDTVENIQCSWPVLRELGASRVALATGRFHMARAAALLGFYGSRASKDFALRCECWDGSRGDLSDCDLEEYRHEQYLLFVDLGRIMGIWAYDKPAARRGEPQTP